MMTMNWKRTMDGMSVVAALLLAASAFGGDAALEFAGIFQDHMVLQQGRSQTVWGKATPGSSVTVKLAKGSATIATSAAATAGSDGVWQATLAVPAATKGDYSAHALSVTSGSTTVTVSDVLLGEVWLASGQSNMQFPLRYVYSKGFDPATIPATIRYRLLGLNGGKTVSTPPYEVAMEKDSAGNPYPWMAAPTAYDMKGAQEGYWYPTFSAVGYFFAKALQEHLDLPVGIVAGVQGDTKLDLFCPGSATLWNYTFGPIQKFAARGLVFYQGEAGSQGAYPNVMKGLVDGYRQRWGNDFAVYYVQIAGGDSAEGIFDWEPMSSRNAYASNREEQRLALGLMGAYANVGMTTAFDYGSPYWKVNGNKLSDGADKGNIHPSAKKPIGERLARLALAKTYGCDLQASGPLFASATATGGGKVEIAFAAGTTGAGFATCRHDYDTNEDVYETKDQPIFGFALAGEDGVWRWAGAKPKAGDATKLVVASLEVPKPKYVRYAYVNNPVDAANLYCRTADGKFLPAIPFALQEISGWSAAGAMSGTASADDCTIAFPLAKYYPAGSSREARPFVWGPNGELLGEGKSYVLSYANNQSAGTATVTVTGRGALTGTKSANFTLTAIEMKSCPATVALNSIGNWPYDGTPKSPGVEFMLPTEISGKMTNRDFYQQRGRSRIMLLEGRDYTVTSVTAPNANAQTFTFTGINGVSGSVTGNATLKIPMGACRADPIPAQAHTGSAVTPKVTLVDPFGKTLVEDTDYTLGYVNNVNAGDCLSSASSPFVKVTAKSSLYAGDLYLPFEIKSGDGLSYTVTFTSFGQTVKSETVARNAAATAPPVSADGWTFDGWDSDFSRVTANLEVKARWTRALTPASFARKATIRFPGAPSETVADFAALVRLSSATIPGFSSADGSDIRFADAQGRLIPHEIDTWRANGESLVWVRVPTLAGPETSVTVYWGGNGAAHPRAEATDTWRGYAGVWHLNEAGTGSGVALGESARALATDGGRTGTACDGVIGGARGNPATTSTFDNKPTFLGRTKATDTPALAGRLGEHFTVSTWVRPNLVSDNLPATLFANSCATELHSRYPDRGFGVKTSGNTNYKQASYDSWEIYFHPKSGVSYLNMGALQKRDVWVKLDLVFDGAELRLYADGRFYRRTKSNGFVFPAFNLSKPFALGGYAEASAMDFNGVYHGDFDEFRLLGEAASAARLEADYATAHDNASFTAYGAATDAQGGDTPQPAVCAHSFGAGTGVDYGNWITGTDYTCSKCGKVRHTLETNCTYTDKILHKLNADGTTSEVSEPTEKPKTTPYLIWYKPEASKDNHKAFVYFPGGGYNNVDVLNGGDQYGRTFAAKGYTVVVCWYRGYNPKDDSPFKDANAAMLAVRAYAKTLGITEVGVAGDSAGGHLASYQHVHGTGDAKSDFAILAFPCITCGESTSYGFSGNIGATTAEKQLGYCNDLFVTATTGRAFIYVATSDAIVPCVNSYRFADALKAKGVPYALHIYKEPAFNGNDHGFEITKADNKDKLSTRIDSWLKATPTTVDERTDYPGTIAVDAARNTYAWKGAAGAKWNAAANWTPSESGSAKGYPADMVYPIAAFSGDATVDLDGKEQYAVQFSLAAGKTLTVKNGTLKCVYHPSYAGANTLRIQNATVERPFYTTEPDKGFGLKGSDSALVLENGSLIGSFYHEGNGAMRLDATGTCSLQDFNDVGAGSGATLAVRDGSLAIIGKGPYSNGGLNHNGGDLTVALSNATVTAANVKHNGGTVRFAIRLGANNTTATPVFKSAGSDNLSKLTSLVFDIDATDVMTAGTYPIYAATGLTLPGVFDPAGATVRCVEGMSGTLAKNGNALDLVLTGSPSGPVIKYGAGYHPETGLTVREKTIACFGDSLTYGEGTTGNRIGNAHFNYGFENNNNDKQTYNYPLFLQESLGDEWDVVSVSQGGQTAESILAWQGGLPLTFGTAVTIPGDGSRSAAWEGMLVGTAKAAASARCFTEPNVWTDTYGAMTGTLDDGSRVRWQCHAWTHKDIARLAATGADKTYPVGTTFIPDSATHFTDAIQVICAGANNGNAAYATVIGFIDKGLEKITGGKANGKYLIVSPHRDKGKNDSTAAMEAAYAAAFGEAHYLNLRREMATRGLQIAVAQGWMTQSAAEATTWDTQETGLLSSDNLHFNTTGYRVFAYLVKEKLQALGYLGETPAPTHAHDWSAWTLVQEATCQQAGSSNRTCRASGCDIGTETVTIPKVGHVYVDGACKWCHAADPSGSHVGAWTSFGLAAADFVPMPADENAALGRCTSRTYVTDGKFEKVDSSKQYGNNSVDISLAEATDITELRVYSAWDSGRDGFGIDWVAVQTAGSSSFVNLDVAEFPYTDYNKFGMCAALKAPDGKKLASGVTAVRVHFSACENSWIGLGEIEVRKAGANPPVTGGGKWYRLTVDSVRSGNNLQLGEFMLYDAQGNRLNSNLTVAGTTEATALKAGECCLAGATQWNDSESLGKLFDGSTETKLGASIKSGEKAKVILRLSAESADVASYNFATGKDDASYSERQLTAWTLEASEDGQTWTEIGKVTSYNPPSQNKVNYSSADFTIGGDTPPIVHAHEYVWTTVTSATCQAAEVQKGTCDCGDVQTRFVGEPVDHVYVDGKCKWCGKQEPSPASGGKWYRLTVDSVRDPSKKEIQFSEFYLYDAQGNRLNSRLAVANVTDASQLAGGQCFLTGVNVWDLTSQNVDKLFDGDMNTKLGGRISDSSNVRIVLRLPEGSAEVAAYNFATASDDNNATWGRPRQLTAWTLEVSEDGRTWTELDKVPLFDPPASGKVKYSAQDFTVGGESREPDTQPVTYTWTGEGGDGCWTNRANWSSSVTPCFGYPDNETYAKAVFNGDATVDLGGAAIETCGTDGQGVTVAANARVTIRNGGLKWNNRNDRGMAVGENATVTLESVALECERYGWEKRHTLVCRGETSLSGFYRPWNVSGALEVRDGATTINRIEGYGGTYSDCRILVSNATLTVTTPTANLVNNRPYLLQRGGKLAVKGTSGTTAIGATTGFSFEGGAFEAPDGLAIDFSGAKEFSVKAAAYGTAAGEYTLIETKGTLTLPDLEGKLDATGMADDVSAELVKSGNTLKLVLSSTTPDLTPVEKPTLSAAKATYSGKVQKPTVAENAAYAVDFGAGNYTSAGKYTVTVSLVDKTATCWQGGGTDDLTLTYEIEKAVLTATASVKNTDAETVLSTKYSPTYLVTVTGFVKGESAKTASGYVKPTASSTFVRNKSAPGTYPVTLSGGAADNYSFEYVNTTITVVSPTPALGEAKWTAYMQGISTDARLEAVRAAVEGAPAVKIAFANSEVIPGKWAHDDYEQSDMQQLADYYGLAIEIIRIPPADPDHGRTMTQVYEEAYNAGDIIMDFSSYWETLPLDRTYAVEVREFVASHPDKLFVCPYGECTDSSGVVPPTKTASYSAALHPDGTGCRHLVLTVPIVHGQPGKLTGVNRRDTNDTETITFVSPSGFSPTTGDTCQSAAMAGIVAAWLRAATGKTAPLDIVDMMAEGRRLPDVSAEAQFSALSRQLLAEAITNYITTAEGELWKRKLIYDAPLSLWGCIENLGLHIHEWSAWTLGQEATCQHAGYSNRTCQVESCPVGAQTNELPAVDHEYVDGACRWCGVRKPEPIDPSTEPTFEGRTVSLSVADGVARATFGDAAANDLQVWAVADAEDRGTDAASAWAKTACVGLLRKGDSSLDFAIPDDWRWGADMKTMRFYTRPAYEASLTALVGRRGGDSQTGPYFDTLEAPAFSDAIAADLTTPDVSDGNFDTVFSARANNGSGDRTATLFLVGQSVAANPGKFRFDYGPYANGAAVSRFSGGKWERVKRYTAKLEANRPSVVGGAEIDAFDAASGNAAGTMLLFACRAASGTTMTTNHIGRHKLHSLTWYRANGTTRHCYVPVKARGVATLYDKATGTLLDVRRNGANADGFGAEGESADELLVTPLSWSKAVTVSDVKVDGADVPLDELFSPANEHRANSGSAIVFPSEPTVVTDETTRTVSIECGGRHVEVPAYYDVAASGRNVALSLNEKAKPGIAVPDEEDVPALVVTDDALSLSADNVIPGFWYWLEMTPQLVPPFWAPCADSLRRAENADAVPLSASREGEAGFYRVRTSDVKPALP